MKSRRKISDYYKRATPALVALFAVGLLFAGVFFSGAQDGANIERGAVEDEGLERDFVRKVRLEFIEEMGIKARTEFHVREQVEEDGSIESRGEFVVTFENTYENTPINWPTVIPFVAYQGEDLIMHPVPDFLENVDRLTMPPGGTDTYRSDPVEMPLGSGRGRMIYFIHHRSGTRVLTSPLDVKPAASENSDI
ncbi:MAG: hypothetical protein ACOC2L_00605 [Candidatus Sumerlaeota bacterium]